MALKSVTSYITLGKLIALLFCLPLFLSISINVHRNSRNELARPVMGTIFLVYKVLS